MSVHTVLICIPKSWFDPIVEYRVDHGSWELGVNKDEYWIPFRCFFLPEKSKKVDFRTTGHYPHYHSIYVNPNENTVVVFFWASDFPSHHGGGIPNNCDAYEHMYATDGLPDVRHLDGTAIYFDIFRNQSAVGPIHANSNVMLLYTPYRLPAKDHSREIKGYVSFDDHSPLEVLLYRITSAFSYMYIGAPHLTPIKIPKDARLMEIWFNILDTNGEISWDSNFGQNYKFSIEP